MVIVSASPVRWSMKSCGNIATDSSHIENAHKIYQFKRRALGQLDDDGELSKEGGLTSAYS